MAGAGLIPDLTARSRRRGSPPPADGGAPQLADKIMHVPKLLTQARELLEEQKIALRDRQPAIKHKYRTWDLYETFPLRDIVGNVNATIWASMLNAALRGMLKTIHNSQNNGDWRPLDAEADITQDSLGEEHLVVAIRWVDMLNAAPLQWANGKAAFNVNVNNTLPSELLERLSASGDVELKELMKQLIVAMTIQATGKAHAATAEPAAKDDE